ncbi:MAG: FtsH protease activity modulator HflK [Alphaproteobacteria bacterium]|nr:MAG: FtsH protease activity modulator HflK [Alphaproteobacteria bacterium]
MLAGMKFDRFFAWDNGQGPWGKPKAPAAKPKVERPYAGRDAAPRAQPELEDVVNQMAERLRGFWRQGGNGGGNLPNPGGVGLEWWGVGLLMVWLASGLYIVAPEEQGVVTRFGAYVKTTDSGLNYRLPWPIESSVKLPVTRLNQLEVGFRSGANREMIMDVPPESMMLTGDQNIVDLDFTVSWRIANPSAFLFNVADPQKTLSDVAESVMRETIGRYPIDYALGQNKGVIQFEARKQMQAVLDYYRLGVAVSAVALQRVNAPEEVIDAFREVQAANADKQRLINEAQGYANQIVPLARGDAARMIEQAKGYKEAAVAEATGDAERFNSKVTAYQNAPAVTRDRLYYETMEQVMKDTPKVVSTGRGTNGVLPFLPLDRLMNNIKPAAGGEVR